MKIKCAHSVSPSFLKLQVLLLLASCVQLVFCENEVDDDSFNFRVHKPLMQLLYESCNLSMLAYNYYKTTDESGNPKDFTRSRSDYDKYEQFLEGSDEAIFASLDGRCFVSFRGTDSSNSEDLISNVGLTYDQISPLYDSSSECTVSSAPRFLGGGYSQVFWNTLLIKNEKGLTIEDELNNCIMENCPTREEDDECVILTGHSQG